VKCPGSRNLSKGSEKRSLRMKAARICRYLEKEYGTPDLGNKANPLDELFYIILSQMTTSSSFSRVFDRLKAKVGNWERLLKLRNSTLVRLIHDAGLSNQKAPRLKAIATKLKADFGAVTLAPLFQMADAEAEQYLTGLPGVGIKTAKCVLMYSLRRNVLPVDTHVARVSRRLGLLPITLKTSEAIHCHIASVVAPELRYLYHVNFIVHGREVCRAHSPKCSSCVLMRICPKARAITAKLDIAH